MREWRAPILSHHVRRQKKIYDPFFTTKEIGKGMGLGLSMVYGIMQNHGGNIVLDASVKKDATFHLYFSVATSSVMKKKETKILSETQMQERKYDSLRGKTVLIADDDPIIPALTRENLEIYGMNVISASDGEEALELARKNREALPWRTLRAHRG